MKFKDLYYATKGFKKKAFSDQAGLEAFTKVSCQDEEEDRREKSLNESRQGLKEFVSEIVSIGRMSHRNLVPLLGYCRRKDELLLVYDYMPNGSLDKYLHNNPEEWEQVVIHRDIKASNVLLDAEHNGRLGDFGLARLCGHGSDPLTTRVAGTWGYLAPDHIRTGKATTATDVFAFGVLLLEVACGRRPIEIQNESECDQREVEMVLKLGLLCSHSDPQARPTMRQVLNYLNGDAMLPDLSPFGLAWERDDAGNPHIVGELSYV
ncbi:unnamed protein product [Microthlaspi erraticum]|uniref:Protein kinase domain-containing protein n=1 Tax=Microthlaspi erraticum TaxID=1685480 RepID=A0A6D2J2G2_9BRAS|nr:unnamed protein product [Microthlaspi erraticum]